MKTRLKPGNETLCHARGLLYVRLESVDDKTFPSPELRKSVFPGLFLCVCGREVENCVKKSHGQGTARPITFSILPMRMHAKIYLENPNVRISYEKACLQSIYK